MLAQLLSLVWLFVTPWIVACKVPLSMGFVRQEYWSGFPFPPQGISSTQGLNLSHGSCIGRQILYHWATWEAPLLNWHQVSLPWPKSKPDKNFYVIKINVQKCFVEMSCYRTEFCSSPWVYPHSQFFSRRLVETSGKVIPESAEFSYLGHFVNGDGEGLGYWNQSDYCNDLDNEPNNGSATLCSLYFITQKVQILISCASLNYGEN